jgi:hypothetical protein
MTPNSRSIFFARFYMYVKPHIRPPQNNIKKSKKKNRTKEGYSQSYYFPVRSLGTAPFLVCIVARRIVFACLHRMLIHHSF